MRYTLADVPVQERMPGFHGQFIHTAGTTHAYWRIDQGAELPEHSHPHEQIVNMLEGELELVVAGALHRLGPGDVLVIAGHQVHSGRAMTQVRVLDVFCPVREDYR